MSLQTTIEAAWDNRSLINEPATKTAIEEIINQLNDGLIRVSSPNEDGTWTTNDWVKKAIILYFPLQQMSIQEVGIFEYHDKMKLKTGYDKIGVRVVPPAVRQIRVLFS